jgi:hypothetical protein
VKFRDEGETESQVEKRRCDNASMRRKSSGYLILRLALALVTLFITKRYTT